jgi:hypothetical protein
MKHKDHRHGVCLSLLLALAGTWATAGQLAAASDYPPLLHPISLKGEQAFEDSPASALSRAALLLILGDLLCKGNREPGCDVATALVAPAKELEDLGFPGDAGQVTEGSQRFSGDALRAGVEKLKGGRAIKPLDIEQLALNQYRNHRGRLEAAEVIFAGLADPDPLVRSAAQCALPHVLEAAEWPRLGFRSLRNGVRSKDDLLREVSATCLARFMPEDGALEPLINKQPDRGSAPGPAHTTLLVHGTWANPTEKRVKPWWWPGGDFHAYLANHALKDLYSGSDPYNWTGGYSHPKRQEAATKLVRWSASHGENRLNVLAHSHGGNVVFLASQDTRGEHVALEFGRAVFLSVPLHPNLYRPDACRFQSVAAIRVHLDLVILADVGGQTFQGAWPGDTRLKDVPEMELPIWFLHSASHDPRVWDDWKLLTWLTKHAANLCPPTAPVKAAHGGR